MDIPEDVSEDTLDTIAFSIYQHSVDSYITRKSGNDDEAEDRCVAQIRAALLDLHSIAYKKGQEDAANER